MLRLVSLIFLNKKVNGIVINNKKYIITTLSPAVTSEE